MGIGLRRGEKSATGVNEGKLTKAGGSIAKEPPKRKVDFVQGAEKAFQRLSKRLSVIWSLQKRLAHRLDSRGWREPGPDFQAHRRS